MKTLTTITGRKLKITSNKSKRHYTIRTESGKYRTFPMDKNEFENAFFWTGNDWNQFLKSEDYYTVK